jgi:signal transduction histidine kinase
VDRNVDLQTLNRGERATAEVDPEQRDRDIGELSLVLNSLGHDLREPLRTIACYSEMLKRPGLNDTERDEYLYFITKATQRMQALVDGLLSYGQIFVSQKARPFEPVDMNVAAQTAIANLQIKIDEAHALVVLDPLPTVWGDPVQLSQLVQNLVGNAIQYRGERKPEILVRAEKQEQDWVFWVEDNGIGIPREYQEAIFQPMKRLHPANSSGSGLGLAICRHIVERHGGRIWVESSSEKGTVFAFRLPRKEAR